MEFTRCYGCMRELKTPGAVCPHCGYDNTNGPAAQPSHVLPCGTVLNGQYLVGRTLGQGGFGITYIGYDLNLEIPVCIKEYYPEGAAMRSATQSRMVYWGTSENAEHLKQSRKSFVKEAQKAVKLRDLSHVVSVWGVFYENETAYIVMDYIEGETLKSRLVRTQRVLGERECVELLTPIMEDLEKAHTRGIVHRDIKPDNIMLTKDGEPMLLDMGAAKDLGKAAQNGGTLSSTMVVSEGFSPLEQYSRSGSIGPWTDVYAMCATIYWCVAGKVPPTPSERMMGEEIDCAALSETLRNAFEKGMALKPGDRMRSMGELRTALNAGTPGVDNRGTIYDQSAVYDCACELKARGVFDLAGSLFKALGDYRDAAKQAAECKKAPRKKTASEKKTDTASEAVAEPGPEPKIEGPKIEKKPPSARKRLLLPIGAVAVLAILTVGIFVGGKGKLPAIADMTAKASAIFRAEETPIPTPSGEPLSTGKFGLLSYEEFKDCIRISGCVTSVTNVEIPAKIDGKPITSIGDNAFRNYSSLKSIIIPDSVTSIGDFAFSNCSSLNSIIIPNHVTIIGDGAFWGCNALTSITIPDSVTDIGYYTFSNCRSLNSITIPDSVTSIGDYAFTGCSSLTSVTIPDSMTSIGNNAFSGCNSLTSITIPDSVTSVGNYAFYGCGSLKSIMIPDSVTSIGDSAFGIVDELSDVYYSGTEEEWKTIQIEAYNDPLTNATIHYNSRA